MLRMLFIFGLFALFSGWLCAAEGFKDAESITKGLGGFLEAEAAGAMEGSVPEDMGGTKDLEVIRTRGIGVKPAQRSTGVQAVGLTASSLPDPASISGLSVDLIVPFEFDSDQLTSVAVRQLDELASALLHPTLERNGFEIIGHTDATGLATYNQTLSERRANAVKSYLISVHRIDEARLSSAGMGEHSPLHASDPHDPRNRRVEIQNVGGYMR